MMGDERWRAMVWGALVALCGQDGNYPGSLDASGNLLGYIPSEEAAHFVIKAASAASKYDRVATAMAAARTFR